MSSEVFNDDSMLEIFRAEVETHTESLTAGLLALERDPGDVTHINEMMRAAHSIKGAARIVGIDPAVRIAHVMEDGFVAAQNGKLILQSGHVDVLLRGVDLLNRVANQSKEPSVDWTQFDGEVQPLVAEMRVVLSGTVPASAPTTPIAAPTASTTVMAPVVSPLSDVTIPLPAMLDVVAAETARRAFVAGLDAHARVVRFDLTLTADLDATGLALLAAAPRCASGSSTQVELVGATDDMRQVLQATGLDRIYAAGSAERVRA